MYTLVNKYTAIPIITQYSLRLRNSRRDSSYNISSVCVGVYILFTQIIHTIPSYTTKIFCNAYYKIHDRNAQALRNRFLYSTISRNIPAMSPRSRNSPLPSEPRNHVSHGRNFCSSEVLCSHCDEERGDRRLLLPFAINLAADSRAIYLSGPGVRKFSRSNSIISIRMARTYFGTVTS